MTTHVSTLGETPPHTPDTHPLAAVALTATKRGEHGLAQRCYEYAAQKGRA